MKDVPLKNPAELVQRLSFGSVGNLLLVDAPAPLGELLGRQRPAESPLLAIEGKAIRSVKQRFDAILVWREDRTGSRALFGAVLKRLEPTGVLWVVTAMKKSSGPATPATHRLELSDLMKAFSSEGLMHDRDLRVSSWHVAHRFVKRKT